MLQAHLCTVWKDGQYKRTRDLEEMRAGFENQLARLETGYVEIGMIHYVDALADWETARRDRGKIHRRQKGPAGDVLTG